MTFSEKSFIYPVQKIIYIFNESLYTTIDETFLYSLVNVWREVDINLSSINKFSVNDVLTWQKTTSKSIFKGKVISFSN